LKRAAIAVRTSGQSESSQLSPAVGGNLRTPNYQHLKRQREAAKKREQQEKQMKRQPPRPPEEAPKEPTPT
jgi:hypothetical protein